MEDYAFITHYLILKITCMHSLMMIGDTICLSYIFMSSSFMFIMKANLFILSLAKCQVENETQTENWF
jgi:hypothetical protein